MNALIIGGSGGLSGEVARQLLDRGYEVYTVTRGNRSLPKGVNSLIVDRNDEDAFFNVIQETN